jgi:hypothetical protein
LQTALCAFLNKLDGIIKTCATYMVLQATEVC